MISLIYAYTMKSAFVFTRKNNDSDLFGFLYKNNYFKVN